MIVDPSEASAQHAGQETSAESLKTNPDENENEGRVDSNDDLHEIQVDDDLNEPDPENVQAED